MDTNITKSGVTIPANEDKEVIEAKAEVAKKYYLTPKYMKWEELFFDQKNKTTFGNATQSACIAYNLDPEDSKAYNVAHVIGSKNIQKVTNLRKRYWEKRGLTPGKLLDLYNNMMVERKDINLLYSIAADMKVELPEYKSIITAKNGLTQNNTQINASDVQVTFTSIEEK